MPVTVYEHEPPATGANANGPLPEAGVTLTIPLHVCVVSVNPVVFAGCVSVTTCGGLVAPVNARVLDETTIAAPAAVAVGDGTGVVGDVVGAGVIGEAEGAGVTGDGVGAPGEDEAAGVALGDATGIGAAETPVGGLTGKVDPPPPPPPPHAASGRTEPNARLTKSVCADR